MADLSHSLTQLGLPMRQRVFLHPPIIKDMTRVFDNNIVRQIQTNARGIIDTGVSTVSAVTAAASSVSSMARAILSLNALCFTQQNRSPWRQYQSLAYEKRGFYTYDTCHGIAEPKRKNKRSYETNMHCEEYNTIAGRNVFLCNDTKWLVEGEKNLSVMLNIISWLQDKITTLLS